ncbi:MAG: hypothetical protein IKJ11_04620 [Clostridia bacterium]|nr:hypothetical protein [Clostridia bacterium]
MTVWILLCMLCFGTAAADGSGAWLTSRNSGYVRLASYVGDYDGYVCVDGFGGVTSADASRVTVISKSASIWADPKTNSKKLGSVTHGESLLCLSGYDARSPIWENGFYAVEHKGQEGWINDDYVVLNDLTITLLESNVPAYIAPDTSSKKVGSLSKLTSYRVIGFYDDYYIINLRGAAAAYIPMDVLHRDNTFERYYHGGMQQEMIISYKTALRTGPDSRYPEIRTLKAGTKVNAADVINGWYMIFDSETGEPGFVEPYALAY